MRRRGRGSWGLRTRARRTLWRWAGVSTVGLDVEELDRRTHVCGCELGEDPCCWRSDAASFKVSVCC